MIRKRLKNESGYSLIEVMVSIMLLTIAILPMAGMFDMGLTSATKGSSYDKARALANLKMEEAKSLPFATVRDNFPVTGAALSNSGSYDSGFIAETGPTAADFANFEYKVKKQSIKLPSQTPTSATEPFVNCDTVTTCTTGTQLIRIAVTVQWGDDNTYTIFGLVA